MADPQIFEDQASQYVLGQLSEPERREFKARLAQSAELRALVGQLEEGLSVLAMTSPPRQPPRQVWKQVEKALAREAKGRTGFPVFWAGWWRQGWAAAGACLVCWLVYAVWVHGARTPGSSAGPITSGVASQSETSNAQSQAAESNNPRERNATETELALQVLQARTQEVTALSKQVANLSKQVTDLAQDLSNKNLLLSDPSRLKFFQLATVPASGSASGATATAPISTNLQRALFFAMARELGWTPEAPKSAVTGSGNNQAGGNHAPLSVTTNLAGVDFVDLRAGNGESASVPNASSSFTPESAGTFTAALTNAIPGFVSGTNAVLAFDPAVMPTGSSLTFVTVRAFANQSSVGPVVLGNNPTVITVPLDAMAWQGGNVTVILNTSAGSSSIIGQFAVPPTSTAQ
jgi:anti-sigma-K factor RskA